MLVSWEVSPKKVGKLGGWNIGALQIWKVGKSGSWKVRSNKWKVGKLGLTKVGKLGSEAQKHGTKAGKSAPETEY